MKIRYALFVDGAWVDSGGDTWDTLVEVIESGILIMPYCNTEANERVHFSFEEFAAIVEMVARVKQEPAP